MGKSIQKVITYHWQEILLGILIFAYIAYFTIASFLRYANFFTGRFDLGNMDQTVWNTVHGRLFQFTNPDGTNIISRLSFHADFLLVLLAPFYLLWQDPRMLLLIQSVIIGLGGIFIFLLAKGIIKNKTLAIVFALLYLLYPALEFSNLYDFHAVTLATTFFLGAIYYLLKRSYIPMTLFLVLAAFTKEQVWLVCGLFGVYIFFFQKKRLLGLSIFAICMASFYYIFFKAIPTAHGGSHFALSYYSDFGSSPTQVIKNIFLTPQKTVATIFTPSRLMFLLELFLPVAFLSLLSPLYLIGAIPDLLIDLLSNNSQFHQIYYQYTSIITPFIFIAAIFGAFKILKQKIRFIKRYIGPMLLGFSLISSFAYGPLPGSKNANVDMFTKPLSYREDVDGFLRDIPAKYSIAATNNVGSHLSHRQKIFTIPNGIDQADLVVFLLTDQFAQPSLKAQRDMANKLNHDPLYVKLFAEQDFIVFAKKSLNFHRRLKKPAASPLLQRIFSSG